jgi:hypothetical protein
LPKLRRKKKDPVMTFKFKKNEIIWGWKEQAELTKEQKLRCIEGAICVLKELREQLLHSPEEHPKFMKELRQKFKLREDKPSYVT